MKRARMPRFAPVALLAASAAVTLASGCKSNEMSGTSNRPETAAKPATMPMDEAPTAMTPATAPAVAAPALKEADYTHTLTMDAPYFASMPMGTAAPAGTMKSGTKVLVMTPGLKYSKVMSEGGVTAYTPTAALRATGK